MRLSGEQLKNFFDRVVVLNLKRRPDRLRRFEKALSEIEWPFKPPEVFEATDGRIETPPSSYLSGPGAWGCLRSHSRIVEETLRRGLDSVLILEDDVCFVEDIAERVSEFLSIVPSDWDQLMLGGQHTLKFNGPPVEEKPGLLRCRDCERTHCYAMRGTFMRTLLDRWQGGGKFNGTVHCDWIMARDPEMQMAHRVYAPAEFLAGQELNHSDIMQSVVPRHYWNPPSPDLPVLLLKSPADVMEALRPYGVHTGHNRDPFTAVEKGLAAIYHIRSQGMEAHYIRLGKWLEHLQWEAGANPHLVCTVWHPQATGAELREATNHPVHVLEAETLEQALEKMPEALRRPRRALRDRNVVIHLCTDNREVIREARNHGWHNGFTIDPETQLNTDLDSLCQNKPERWRRIGTLRRIIASLRNESSTILGGVPVVWHPGIDPGLVREVTDAEVVEIEADTPHDALEQWRLHQESQPVV